MSKSTFNVMGITLQFRVCALSPEPFERFSLNFAQMILSVGRCAQAMTLSYAD